VCGFEQVSLESDYQATLAVDLTLGSSDLYPGHEVNYESWFSLSPQAEYADDFISVSLDGCKIASYKLSSSSSDPDSPSPIVSDNKISTSNSVTDTLLYLFGVSMGSVSASRPLRINISPLSC